MSEINDGGSAFPRPAVTSWGGPSAGMTLRDYFAGQALCGLLANPAYGSPNPKEYAAQSYAAADGMIAKREEAK